MKQLTGAQIVLECLKEQGVWVSRRSDLKHL